MLQVLNHLVSTSWFGCALFCWTKCSTCLVLSVQWYTAAVRCLSSNCSWLVAVGQVTLTISSLQSMSVWCKTSNQSRVRDRETASYECLAAWSNSKIAFYDGCRFKVCTWCLRFGAFSLDADLLEEKARKNHQPTNGRSTFAQADIPAKARSALTFLSRASCLGAVCVGASTSLCISWKQSL